MHFDRRTMLAGAAASMALAGPSLARSPARPPGWYPNAIIIDGLGGIRDPCAWPARLGSLRLEKFFGGNLLRLYGDAWGG